MGGEAASGRQEHTVLSTADPEKAYTLLEQIGKGSYGKVYSARSLLDLPSVGGDDDETLCDAGDLVALKVIELDDEDDVQSLTAQVRREVETLRLCDSPHVLRYFGSYHYSGRLWIVTELCAGGSLLDVMKARGVPLSVPQLQAALASATAALRYLHETLRITHRDVKAANLLLTSSAELRLADFGVSVQLSQNLSLRSTTIGTPHWMAPEVIQSGAYDTMADIWSLGITLIELAQLNPPHWDVRPVMRALFYIPAAPSPTLDDPSAWPPLLSDFLSKCVAKEPCERYSAAALQAHAYLGGRRTANTAVLRPLLEPLPPGEL